MRENDSSILTSSESIGIILVTLFLIGSFFLHGENLEINIQHDLARYPIEIIHDPDVEYTFPKRADPQKMIGDYSLHEAIAILPQKTNQTDEYITYPKYGIISPINTPHRSDQLKIEQGKPFNHYPYLETGVLRYRGDEQNGIAKHIVVAGHSSFLKSEPGLFKTVFQALPISTAGDTIHYFKKNEQGGFDKYVYTIFSSYETKSNDISILTSMEDQPILTTYACYPIGSNERRRVNKAQLTDIIKDHSGSIQEHASANEIDGEIITAPQQMINDPKNRDQEIDHKTQIKKGQSIIQKTVANKKETYGLPNQWIQQLDVVIQRVIDIKKNNPPRFKTIIARISSKALLIKQNSKISPQQKKKFLKVFIYILKNL